MKENRSVFASMIDLDYVLLLERQNTQDITHKDIPTLASPIERPQFHLGGLNLGHQLFSGETMNYAPGSVEGWSVSSDEARAVNVLGESSAK